jgi:hypothetical protein
VYCAVLCWTICTFHFSQFASTIQDGARLASHPSVCHVRCLGANSTRQDCGGCGGTACWCMCVCSVYSSVICIAIRVLQQYRDELSYNEEIIQLHPILSHPVPFHAVPSYPILSHPMPCRPTPSRLNDLNSYVRERGMIKRLPTCPRPPFPHLTPPLYSIAIFAVAISAAVAEGWRVRNVILIAFACTFISTLARHPTVTLSPAGVRAPVRNAAVRKIK